MQTEALEGSLVMGRAPIGTKVSVFGKDIRVGADGSFVFAVPREAEGSVRVTFAPRSGIAFSQEVKVLPKQWVEQRVNGVPPATVNPPPAIAERIAREQALVVEARKRDDDREDFLQTFIWPVRGRISGQFGNRRVYNGQPGSAHSGADIAAPAGTPIKAPADGVISFANKDLYLTGGTVVLDHGFGVSTNYLHMSRIDVKVGDVVKQGQVIGAVGSTGRATGPHLHWGMSWFETRVDPLLMVK
ncbi:M23 family metallopeptidase [Lysobacter soyae]|uniref:M23 family metallopeptidase n=2 Tax=Lysobacter soyae TaxID=2764185 RepID=A0ABX8WT25_9GAMM|nr:M23 family metallopeptidase [Lysobacter sp. CJ11]